MAEIVIIGGGVSGLSAGIYSALGGHRVRIYEKHTEPGGNLTGWQRGSYHIDNCIHWLTGTCKESSLYRTWVELGALGGGVRIIKQDTLYTVEHDGESLSLYRDLDRCEREMLDASGKDARKTRELIRAVRALQRLSGLCRDSRTPGYVGARSVLSAPLLLKYHLMSTGELTQSFRSPLLKKFVTAFFGTEFSALALITVIAHFTADNGDIPEGGSRAMARRMSERFISLGGELFTGKRAVKVELKDGRAEAVLFSDGERVVADYVIVATEPYAAFGSMIDLPLPKRLKRDLSDGRLFRFSSYHCAFSCSTDVLPFEGDHILEVPEEYRRVLGSGTLIVRSLSHDSEFAPEGRCVIQSMVFCDEESSREFIRLCREDKREYKRLKDKLAITAEYLICERFPGLKGRIKIIDAWTPATYNRYTAAQTGSYMAFAIPKGYIPGAISPAVRGASNLFLATQWQSPPGGLPNAALAGKRAAEAIAAREKRAVRVKTRRAGRVRAAGKI